MKKTMIGIIALGLLSSYATAEQAPKITRHDPRVMTLDYSPDEVYRVRGYYNQETMIIFGETEEVSYVGVGDPLSWQKPHYNGRYLLIKPIEDFADTNMNVLTRDGSGEERRYTFALDAEDTSNSNRKGTWRLQFRYTSQERADGAQALAVHTKAAPKASAQPRWNLRYAYDEKGDVALKPVDVRDDGEFTYFVFDDHEALPAIYAISADGEPTMVNFHLQGDNIVVQQLADQFLLKQNDLQLDIYRQGEADG